MKLQLTLLSLLLLVASARADDAQAEALYETYLGARTEGGFRANQKRIETLRSLGALRSPRARELLVRIARTARDKDDQLLSVLALGAGADLTTHEILAKHLGRKAEPELLRAWANGLARNPDPEIAAWLETEGITSSKVEFLEACAHALAGHRGHGAAGVLIELYRKHGGNRGKAGLVHEVVLALGASLGDEANETLLAAAAHKDERIRLAAAEVLPHRNLADPAIHAALRELLGDPMAAIRQTAARSIGVAKAEALVPELISLLEADPRPRTRYEAYLALKAISGLDFKFDAGTWRKWWESKQAGLEAKRMSFASYYGFSVHSDRILFLVDLSGSMRWDGGGQAMTRLEVARTELIKVLKELPEQCLFNIMVYSDKVAEWRKKEEQASPKNVARAIKWVEHTFREPEGDTHTHSALEAAFDRNPEFDTLYFLSDGIPSHGEYISHEGILASVELWNRFRRSVLNTFALTYTGRRPDLVKAYRGEREFMTALAKGTGGEVRIIRRPPR